MATRMRLLLVAAALSPTRSALDTGSALANFSLFDAVMLDGVRGECSDAPAGAAPAAGRPRCGAAMCASLFLQELPRSMPSPRLDFLGGVRCEAFAAKARAADAPLCSCAAPPIDTLARFRRAADGLALVTWGDSTARNYGEVLQMLEALGDLAGPKAAAYYAERVVKATRAATRAEPVDYQSIWCGGKKACAAELAAVRGLRAQGDAPAAAAAAPWKGLSHIWDKHTYLRLVDAKPDLFNHDAHPSNPRRRRSLAPGTTRAWLINAGLHSLGSFDAGPLEWLAERGEYRGRHMNPRLAFYRSDIANATHALLRQALAAPPRGGGAYARLVLVWKATVFVCPRGLYGDWAAAAKALASAPRTPRSAASASCVGASEADWTRGPAPAWGALGLREACTHATVDAHGAEFLNRIAAETIREINACYLLAHDDAAARARWDGARDAVPCPDDLRGVAIRRPEWRLPGVYVLSVDQIGATLCGHVDGDGVHAEQVYLPMTRALLAALGPAS